MNESEHYAGRGVQTIKPGDKIIYAFFAGLENGYPRIGYLIQRLETHPMSYVGATPETHTGDCDCIFSKNIHPYSDALWAAWCQWLEDDHRVREQHRLLMAGEVPAIGLL